MPKAVSNSSPLINLAAINRLALLRAFYDEVLIPPAVWQEVVVECDDRPGGREVERAADGGWIRVLPVSDVRLLRLLRRELDDGEAEAIALAIEQSPEVVLLDETEGRRLADMYSLKKTGVVGLLLRAKREGQLVALKPELDRLREQAGFWIDDDLYERALAAVGE